VPTVLTTEAALQLMGSVSGTHELMAKGLYGTGRRRMECLRLRVTDLDCAPQQIVVRDGNGMEDRVTMRLARRKVGARRTAELCFPTPPSEPCMRLSPHTAL
jgi:integrase